VQFFYYLTPLYIFFLKKSSIILISLKNGVFTGVK